MFALVGEGEDFEFNASLYKMGAIEAAAGWE